VVAFSVVIPILNEEHSISELLARLGKIIHEIGDEWEVIYVNDGSTDRSLDMLRSQRVRYPYLRIVDLSRNFGHVPALTAGIDHARGRAVILMDGDLQDSPEALPEMIQKWRDGYEVVYAIRARRKEGLTKRLLFAAFYRLQRRLSGVAMPLDAGIFSLLDHRVVKALRDMPERHRYLPGLRAYAGFRQAGVVVEREARYEGKPRVPFGGLVKLAMDGMFAFSTLPLRIVFVMGIFVCVISLIIASIGFIDRYVLGHRFLEWPFGLTTVFFFGGVQLVAIGTLGEYVGRIYEEVKRRPYYVVRETIGFESGNDDCQAGQQ
jgi:polyisoprenyl-phosphate glycosyltransferase